MWSVRNNIICGYNYTDLIVIIVVQGYGNVW